MLFEIHDAFLRRMWVHFDKQRLAILNRTLDSSVPLEEALKQSGKYWRVKRLAALFKHWYMNHYPKLHFVFPD